MKKTLISILLPIKNGEDRIAKCLESLLSQTYSNFELIIRDNCSTDGTWRLLRSIAASDSRLKLRKNNEDVGAFRNLRLCCDEASGEYVMAAAHDDIWANTFIEHNLCALQENTQAVASIGKVIFAKDSEFRYHSNGDFPLAGPVGGRLQEFFSTASDNSRFYSLFRSHVFKYSISFQRPFHAADWYISARSLLRGEHFRVESTGITREVPVKDKYISQVARDNEQWPIFLRSPLGPLTFKIVTTFPLHLAVPLVPLLLKINRRKKHEYRHFNGAF